MPRTNRRIADDRFACCRPTSMLPTRFDKVSSRTLAISRNPFQNASSRLTLALCPPRTIEGLMTEDFIVVPPRQRKPIHMQALRVVIVRWAAVLTARKDVGPVAS